MKDLKFNIKITTKIIHKEDKKNGNNNRRWSRSNS